MQYITKLQWNKYVSQSFSDFTKFSSKCIKNIGTKAWDSTPLDLIVTCFTAIKQVKLCL